MSNVFPDLGNSSQAVVAKEVIKVIEPIVCVGGTPEAAFTTVEGFDIEKLPSNLIVKRLRLNGVSVGISCNGAIPSARLVTNDNFSEGNPSMGFGVIINGIAATFDPGLDDHTSFWQDTYPDIEMIPLDDGFILTNLNLSRVMRIQLLPSTRSDHIPEAEFVDNMTGSPSNYSENTPATVCLSKAVMEEEFEFTVSCADSLPVVAWTAIEGDLSIQIQGDPTVYTKRMDQTWDEFVNNTPNLSDVLMYVEEPQIGAAGIVNKTQSNQRLHIMITSLDTGEATIYARFNTDTIPPVAQNSTVLINETPTNGDYNRLSRIDIQVCLSPSEGGGVEPEAFTVSCTGSTESVTLQVERFSQGMGTTFDIEVEVEGNPGVFSILDGGLDQFNLSVVGDEYTSTITNNSPNNIRLRFRLVQTGTPEFTLHAYDSGAIVEVGASTYEVCMSTSYISPPSLPYRSLLGQHTYQSRFFISGPGGLGMNLYGTDGFLDSSTYRLDMESPEIYGETSNTLDDINYKPLSSYDGNIVLMFKRSYNFSENLYHNRVVGFVRGQYGSFDQEITFYPPIDFTSNSPIKVATRADGYYIYVTDSQGLLNTYARNGAGSLDYVKYSNSPPIPNGVFTGLSTSDNNTFLCYIPYAGSGILVYADDNTPNSNSQTRAVIQYQTSVGEGSSTQVGDTYWISDKHLVFAYALLQDNVMTKGILSVWSIDRYTGAVVETLHYESFTGIPEILTVSDEGRVFIRQGGDDSRISLFLINQTTGTLIRRVDQSPTLFTGSWLISGDGLSVYNYDYNLPNQLGIKKTDQG